METCKQEIAPPPLFQISGHAPDIRKELQGIENTAFGGSKESELEIWGSLGIRGFGELGICRGLMCLGVQGELGVRGVWKWGIGVFEGLNGVGGSTGV